MDMTPEEKLRAAGATVTVFRPEVIQGGLSNSPDRPWLDPLPIVSALPPVQRLRYDMLPKPIADYVFDVAERQQSPVDFSAVSALCALAAVVGNRVRICPKQNDNWEVVPNLWGAIIGRPSAMKSPAMQSALAPLYALQDEMRTGWEGAMREKRVDEALSDMDAKDAKKRAAKALNSGDRDAARKIIADLEKDEEEQPCPRIVVNDATVEKLGELLNENERGLLLVRDELPGFLARMESEEHQSERAFYLEAFNGDGQFTYDRIGRGTTHIEHCTLSIIGGVQPSRIAPIVRGAMTGASNDGLIQRLQLAVWPDDNREWKYVDRHQNLAAREAYEKVFRDLHLSLPGSTEYPTLFHFEEWAQNAFVKWFTAINNNARNAGLSSALESHLLKMPKTIATLAVLFELIDGGRFEVHGKAVTMALEWASYLVSHAHRLYAAGNTLAEDGARLIVERRRQLPTEFTARDVQRKAWATLGDKDAVSDALEILVGTHHCREVPVTPGAAGGRPSSVYQWNPALLAER
jgi:hypothetical protein